MSDPINNDDEEFDFDDDFDDNFDLSDEDFDDGAFDDAPEVELPDSSSVQAEPPQKKSFVSRYFNVLLITSVLVVGGIFILTQFSGQSSNQAFPDQTPQEIHQAESSLFPQPDNSELASGIIPSPVPFSQTEMPMNVQDEVISQDTDIAEFADPGVLTPLPEIDFNTDENSEFSTAENGAEIFIDDVPMEFSDEIIANDMLFEPDSPMSEPSDDFFTNVDVSNPNQPLPVQGDATNEIPTEPQDIQTIAVEADSQTSRDMDAMRAEIENLRNSLVDVQSSYNSVQSELEKAQQRIAELENLNRASKKEINQLREANAQKEKMRVESQNESPQPQATVKSQKLAEKPQAWALRSASVGRAVVSKEGTNDLKTVEIGDHLPIIGTIRSISQEDGRWVIIGSKGNISQ